VAEAVERGLNRREKEGKEISSMHHVCTLMIGRLDDWIQITANKEDILVDPGYLHWPGIAVFKRAYEIYQERGYRTRALVAAYRHHMHWSALIGGDIVHTIPYSWQVLYNASGIPVTQTWDIPVDPKIVNTLYEKFAEFRKAYDPDGMSIDEFDAYGATVRTLRGFIGAVHDLTGVIRDVMLPNPDVK
jgi:transaldolase